MSSSSSLPIASSGYLSHLNEISRAVDPDLNPLYLTLKFGPPICVFSILSKKKQNLVFCTVFFLYSIEFFLHEK